MIADLATVAVPACLTALAIVVLLTFRRPLSAASARVAALVAG